MSAFGEGKDKKKHADWMKDPFVADEGIFVKSTKPIYRETDPKEYPRKRFRTKDLIVGGYALLCAVYVTVDIIIYLIRKLFE